MSLFDKHARPVITGHSESADWANCEAWESYVYDNADVFSEDQWDGMVNSIQGLYDDFFELWG